MVIENEGYDPENKLLRAISTQEKDFSDWQLFREDGNLWAQFDFSMVIECHLRATENSELSAESCPYPRSEAREQEKLWKGYYFRRQWY